MPRSSPSAIYVRQRIPPTEFGTSFDCRARRLRSGRRLTRPQPDARATEDWAPGLAPWTRRKSTDQHLTGDASPGPGRAHRLPCPPPHTLGRQRYGRSVGTGQVCHRWRVTRSRVLFLRPALGLTPLGRRLGTTWSLPESPRGDGVARGLPRLAGEMASACEPEGGRSGRTGKGGAGGD